MKILPSSATLSSRVLLFLVLLVPLLSAQSKPQPWDNPFSPDTSAIWRAATALSYPADTPAAILLEDHHYTVDKAGHLSYSVRKVYRLLEKDEEGFWSTVEAQYLPWREQKPRVRARVIAKDGSVHLLDAATLTDSPAREFDNTIFSDRRVVRAPLPAAAEGAVVEFEIAGELSPAFTEAGIARRVGATAGVPVERFHVRIDAAKGAPPVRTVARLIPDSALHRQTSGETRVEVDLGPLTPTKDYEFNLPSDTPSDPYIAFSTGSSWNALAAKYSEIVDKQIRGADLKAFMEGIDLTGTPAAVAGRIVNRLHRQIRYTGMELNEAAIVPATPEEVLRRKYGDCKDKSALLVAMLRAAGLKAQVALLLSGTGKDTDEELPGLDLFDHAIVFLEGTAPAGTHENVWIDATASETRFGALPAGAQGRYALIASASQTTPVKTPVVGDSVEKHLFEIRFSSFGPGSVTERVEATNSAEASYRSQFGGDDTRARGALEKYVTRSFGAKALGKYSIQGANDLTEPFIVSAEGLQSPQAMTTDEAAGVTLAPGAGLQMLPYALMLAEEPAPAKENGTTKRQPRIRDFVFNEPVHTEFSYKLYPPPLFRAGTLPESKESVLGAITWTRTYRTNDDGSVEAVFRVQAAKQRLTAAEFEKTAAALKAETAPRRETITFIPETAELAATGQTAKALSILTEDAAKHQTEAGSHVRLSRFLLNAGLGGTARKEARKAVELEPKSSQAWQTQGWIFQHDLFGRRFASGWDPAKVEESYRKALQIDADDVTAKMDLAIVFEHNQRGLRYGRGARLEEAIRLYRELLAKNVNPVVQGNLGVALLMAGKIDEAREASKVMGLDAALLAAALYDTVHNGPGRAVANMQAQIPDPLGRSRGLAQAALMLFRMRRYDDGRMLLTAAGRAGNATGVAQISQVFAGIKKREDVTYPDSDCRRTVQQLIAGALDDKLLDDKLQDDKLQALMGSADVASSVRSAVEELRAISVREEKQLATLGLSEDSFADLTASRIVLQADGDDERGFVVTAEANFNKVSFYLRKDNGSYQVVGTSLNPAHAGELALDLLESNKLAAAQWLLDHLATELRGSPAEQSEPVARVIWSGVTPETRGPDAVRRAAASILGRYSNSPRAIGILEKEVPRGKTARERAQLRLALCEAYLKAGDWPKVAATARALAVGVDRQDIYAYQSFEYRARAAREQKKWKDLAEAAEGRLLQNGAGAAAYEDPEALRALVVARLHLGDFDGAKEPTSRLKKASHPDAETFRVWASILAKKADEKLLTEISAPEEDRRRIDSFARSILQVLLDHPDESRDSLRLAMGDESADDFDARPWVIQGLIAKKYGMPEEAADCFRRAREVAGGGDFSQWSLSVIPK